MTDPTEAELDNLDARCVELIRSREGDALAHRPAPTDLREAVAGIIADDEDRGWAGMTEYNREMYLATADRILALVSAPRADGVTDLDRAWRAVDALGGPWPSDGDLRDHHMEEGYNRALDEACKAIEKLGGRDKPSVAPRAVTDADVERARTIHRHLPLTFKDTPDYAEIWDRNGEVVAMTRWPDLFRALAALQEPRP